MKKDLIGEKIFLRSIQMEDTETILKLRNSLDVRKKFIFQEDFTEEGHEEWMCQKVFTGLVEQFMICLKDGTAIGSVYLRDIDSKNKKAEFGIFIGSNGFRAKGIGTEATMLITNFGFEILNLEKIFLRVFADNIGAIKCYEKAGFVQEGLFKKDIYIDGKPKDLIFMAKFNENKDSIEKNRQ